MLARQRRLQVEVAKPSLLRGPKKLYVLVLGLDRVGKTTFVYRLKLNRKIVSIPTVGANRESVTKPFPVSKPGTQPLERVFKFTDVGGITPMRLLWSEYLRVETKKIVCLFLFGLIFAPFSLVRMLQRLMFWLSWWMQVILTEFRW